MVVKNILIDRSNSYMVDSNLRGLMMPGAHEGVVQIPLWSIVTQYKKVWSSIKNGCSNSSMVDSNCEPHWTAPCPSHSSNSYMVDSNHAARDTGRMR